MNDDGPIVGLRLDSRPQSLTIVRAMLSGLAELLEMDPELLDDLKTVVSEACNNVVLHAYAEAPGPLEIHVFADPVALRVIVRDEGRGLDGGVTRLEAAHGIGVSVIRALAAEVRFSGREPCGTEVTMTFAAERDGIPLFDAPSAAVGEQTLPDVLDGEIAVTLSPVNLLAGVLGRLARTLAASAHFSLDRFSDVYLITDTLAAHASQAAASERVLARLIGGERRLSLVVGPFRPGASARLAVRDEDPLGSPLAQLADEIAVRDIGHQEEVGVVVVDHRR